MLRDELSEQIMHIVRALEHDTFMPESKRASLEEELSKLIEMRKKHDEHKEKEKQKKMDKTKW